MTVAPLDDTEPPTEILVVEDEQALRAMIVEELEEAGYVAREAANGKKALELIAEQLPAMVIADINMPVLDGYGLLKALREDFPQADDLPFVFLSAQADRDSVIKGLRVGADDYVSKPVDYEYLLTKVASHLRKRRPAHPAQASQSMADIADLSTEDDLLNDLEQFGEDDDLDYLSALGAELEAAPGAVRGGKGLSGSDPKKGTGGQGGPGPQIIDGKIAHIIDLGGIRDALGDEWLTSETRAMQIAEATIQARLHSHDQLHRTKDNNFQVVFQSLDARDGARVASGLADLVYSKLVGERATALPLSAGSEESEGTAVAAEGDDGDEGDVMTARLMARVTQRSKVIEAETLRVIKELREDGNITCVPVLSATGGKPANVRITSFDRISQTKVDLLLRIRDQAPEVWLDIDMILLGHVADSIINDVGGSKDMMIVPVHYSIMRERPLAQKFLNFCAKIPDDIKGRLIFNIIGVSEDTSLSPWAAAALASHSRLRMIQLAKPRLKLDLVGARISIVNMQCRAVEHELWEDPSRLRRFVDQVHIANGRFLLSEIPQGFLSVVREAKPDLLAMKADTISRY